MSKEIIFNSGITKEAIEFFEVNKNFFGQVIKAQMKADEIRTSFTLILQNKENKEMIFNGCFSSGYKGEGCKGTLKVLKECGFDIDIEYVANNLNFILEK